MCPIRPQAYRPLNEPEKGEPPKKGEPNRVQAGRAAGFPCPWLIFRLLHGAIAQRELHGANGALP